MEDKKETKNMGNDSRDRELLEAKAKLAEMEAEIQRQRLEMEAKFEKERQELLKLRASNIYT